MPARERRLGEQARRLLVGRRRLGARVERQRAEGEAGRPLDPLGARIEGAPIDLRDAIGEEIEQPLGLDARGEAHRRRARGRAGAAGAAAVLDDVDRHQPVAGLREPQLGAAARRQQRRRGARLAPPRHAIGEGRQHRQPERASPRRSAAALRRAARGERRRRAGAARARPPRRRAPSSSSAAQRVGAKARRLRLAEEIDEIDEVGAAVEPRPGRHRRPNDARAVRADVALGDRARPPGAAASPAPRVSPSTTSRASRGWTGKRSIRRPTSVSAPPRVERAQPAEQLARGAPARRRAAPRARRARRRRRRRARPASSRCR